MAELKQLKNINVKGNPLVDTNPKYNNELFDMIKTLETVDSHDKEGKEVESSLYDEEDEEFDEEGEEFEDEGEEFDDDDEGEEFDDEDAEDDDNEDDDSDKKPKKKQKKINL